MKSLLAQQIIDYFIKNSALHYGFAQVVTYLDEFINFVSVINLLLSLMRFISKLFLPETFEINCYR